MHRTVVGGLALIAPTLFLTASCGDVYTADDADSAVSYGNLAQACLQNGACNTPYQCVDNTCVASQDAQSNAPIDASASGTCPLPIFSSEIPPYKGPNLLFGRTSCTVQDMETLKELVDVATDSTDADWFANMTKPCAECMFSGVDDATWATIVVSPNLASINSQQSTFFVNIGPCYQEVPGGTAACGQAAQAYNACIEVACPSPVCDSDLKCEQEAQTSRCASELAAWSTACGPAFDSIASYCNGYDGLASVFDLVDAVCGPGYYGSDGGSEEAGDAGSEASD